MSTKGANLFRGQISTDFWPLGGGFYPSRSVVENKCLIEHPGTLFGIKISRCPDAVLGRAKLPRNRLFIPANGFSDCQRPEEKEPVRRATTKKCGSPLTEPLNWENRSESGLPLFLFPILEDIIQRYIQCGFQAFFHNPENLRL